MANSSIKNVKFTFIFLCILANLFGFLSISVNGQNKISPPLSNLCKVKKWKCAEDKMVFCKLGKKPIWLSSRKMMKLVLKKIPILSGAIGKNRLYGYVTMKVLVDLDGNVLCVEGIKGHPIAQSIAVGTIHNWIFNPLKVNNKPISFVGILTVPFDFRK